MFCGALCLLKDLVIFSVQRKDTKGELWQCLETLTVFSFGEVVNATLR